MYLKKPHQPMIQTVHMNPAIPQQRISGQALKNKNFNYVKNTCSVDFAPTTQDVSSLMDLMNWERTTKWTLSIKQKNVAHFS